MVTLLGPEEDTVVHEFAALCLVSLASDFSSKVAIYEQDGLEPLIRCLGSHDPDVQKNSIETIASMLQVSEHIVFFFITSIHFIHLNLTQCFITFLLICQTSFSTSQYNTAYTLPQGGSKD